ncbi:MAG: hypothetical protein Q8873_00495 [Bacillota bacterium]|nr:hypothetical protein [Bacillota bacterium]
MTVEISLLIAIVGCFIGLGGWLSGRDKKIANDGEWKGTVNTKLDQLIEGSKQTATILAKLQEHGERLTAVEESAKQAHLRINRIEKTRGE